MSVEDFNSKIMGMIEDVRYSEPDPEGNVEYPNFSGAIFPGDINMWPHDSEGALPRCMFHNVTFCGEVDFSHTNIFDSDFTNCVFLKDALFERCRVHSISFRYAVFFGNASFKYSKFSETPSFRCTQFGGMADFNNCDFRKGGIFRYTEFMDKANFFRCFSDEGELHFQVVDMEDVSFSCGETPMFRFQTCYWPERLHPDRTDNYMPKALEDLYRSLKLLAAEEHNMPMVSRWHFNEKMMALEQVPKARRLFSMTWWYWLSSGFGEKPIRAFGTLLALVFIPLFILSLLSLVDTGITSSFDKQAVNAVFTDWLRCFPLSKAPKVSSIPAGRLWFYWGAQVLISIQAALFGFALRNKFRR